MVLQDPDVRQVRARWTDGRSRLPRLGEDALSQAAASTSRWDAADYARVGAFVAELGTAALDLLDPKPGERVLDVGCGDGVLTKKIAERGAQVTGIDNSLDMIRAAHANGVDALVVDSADIQFDREFHAAFSNAALHWMLDREAVAGGIFRALKPGGRFAGKWAARATSRNSARRWTRSL